MSLTSEEIKPAFTGSLFIKSVERYFLLSSANIVIAPETDLLISNALIAPIKLAPEEIPTPSPNSLDSICAIIIASPSSTDITSSN